MTDTTKQAPKGLIKKLAEVMGEVNRIPKHGRNEFHRYDYATEADIVEAVRGALAVRFIMMVPNIESMEWSMVERQKGGQDRLCTLKVRFDLIDGETGEVLSLPMYGQGSDGSDKAIYKAMTGATKYALLKLFLIPTGDDPETETEKPHRQASEPRPPEQRTAPSGEATVPFGKHKGTPVSALSLKQLDWYMETARKELSDSTKEKFWPKTRVWLEQLEHAYRLKDEPAQPDESDVVMGGEH